MTFDRLSPSGFLLFIDSIVLTVGGGLFWLVISKLVSPDDIGLVAAVISLSFLISGIARLGNSLEIPILREINREKAHLFGTLSLLEMLVHVAVIPVLLLVGVYYYNLGNANELIMLAIFLLLSTGMAYISKQALLGLLQNKMILIFDSIGVTSKFIIAIALIHIGLGSFGLLSAITFQQAVVAVAFFLLCYRKIGFKISAFTSLKAIMSLAVGNITVKVSQLVITNFSVVFLALMGLDSALVGIFYIVLMLIMIVSSFSQSLATMAIPTSQISRTELSGKSTRTGLSLTAPVLAVMLTSPYYLLSLINESYAVAEKPLIILALAVIPYILTLNAVTKLNNLNDMRRLTVLGFLQLSIYFTSLIILTTYYGIIGTSVAILVTYIATAVPSLKWLGREAMKYTLITFGSIILGWSLGLASSMLVDLEVVQLAIAAVSSFAVIIITKNITPTEILSLFILKNNR